MIDRRSRQWLVLSALTAAVLIVPSQAGAHNCKPGEEPIFYDDRRAELRFDFDMTGCHPERGTTTVTLLIQRNNETATEKTFSCPVVDTCTGSVGMDHPPLEWARYLFTYNYASDGRVRISGGMVSDGPCQSVVVSYGCPMRVG